MSSELLGALFIDYSMDGASQLGHYLSFSLNINILYVHITFSSFTKNLLHSFFTQLSMNF